jgi:hypothetical protein
MGTDSEDGGEIFLEDVSTSEPDYSIKTQTIMRSEILNMSRCYSLEIHLLSSGIFSLLNAAIGFQSKEKKSISSTETKDV